MAVAITTNMQDVYPPRVLVTVTGLTIGDNVEVYRSVGGRETLVRGSAHDAITDTSLVVLDAELPFGVPVTYFAFVNGARPSMDLTRNTFDATSESWAGEVGVTVTRVTSPVHDGAGALQASKTMGAGFDSVRFNDNQGSRDISGSGPTLAVWAQVPAGAAGTGWQARIELQDAAFTWHAGPTVAMTAGTWALLTYSPDASLMAACRSIGVQFGANGVNASQAVYIDTVQQLNGGTTYTLPGGKVVLSDAINGLAAEAVILAWPSKTFERRASRFSVGGRNVVVTGPLGQFAGTVDLFTETTSARDNVMTLAASSVDGIVQVRQPGGYDGIDSFVAITGIEERRHSQDGDDQRRIISLSVVETETWNPLREAKGYTLQDIHDAYVFGSPVAVGSWTFTSTTESWSIVGGGSLARVATPSNDGNGSLRWTMATGTNDLILSPTGTSGLQFVTAGPLKFTARVMTPDTIDPVNIYVPWYNAAGSGLGGTIQSVPVTLTPNVWTTLTAEGGSDTTAGVDRLAAGVYIPGSLTTGELLYVDSMTVERTGQSLADLSNAYATLLALAQAEFG